MTGRLIEETAVLGLAHDIVVGEYRHRCIDPSAVRQLPTVEAIPIEWLRNLQDKYYEESEWLLFTAVGSILEEWEKTHE